MSGRRRTLNRTPAQRAAAMPMRGQRRSGSEPAVPDVYQEMLWESGVPPPPAKKRRKVVKAEDDEIVDTAWPTAPPLDPGPSRTSALVQEVDENAEDENAGDETDDSDDVNWEDVDLTAVPEPNRVGEENGILEVTLNDPNQKSKSLLEKKRATAVDRKIRLETHKLHLLCLLAHVSRRNIWCNNNEVQDNLRGKILLDDTTISNLNPAPQLHQVDRNSRFLGGLTEAKRVWRKKYWITHRGLTKPYWLDLETLNKMINSTPTCEPKMHHHDDGDPPMTKSDFIDASKKLEGSRDLGAQLFCALLRSVSVTTRLVCSLQPLPFSFVQKGPQSGLSRFSLTTQITKPPISPPAILCPPKVPPLVPQHNPRILGSPKNQILNIQPGPQATLPGPPRIPVTTVRGSIVIKNESPFPVFWIEAWNVATQRWIPMDPLVMNTIDRASKFEPPLNDPDNSMSYVVAFEDGGCVKDVTRRYAKNFNAKTRKLRLDSTKGGELWWLEVMKLYERSWDLDRDQLEEAELANRALSEGIPSSIADLKDHPIFALKRHLRRNQVIHPERPVGSVNTGMGRRTITEAVYRRQDVTTVRSSMQWYRLGREIKTGEQPLKHITARKKKSQNFLEDEEDEDGEMGLYAIFQTEIYIPPPIVDGIVPKNSFGNVDVYVSSMIPSGGIHIPHKSAAKAAKIIGVDYAEAVIGFEHKSRQASAVINGIIIAEEYKDAVYAVLNALISEREQQESEMRAMESLRLWRRFLIGLRIRERIEREYGDVEEGEGEHGWEERRKLIRTPTAKGKGKGKAMEGKDERHNAVVDEVDEEEEHAGGFLKDSSQDMWREPISLRSLAAEETETVQCGSSHVHNVQDGKGIFQNHDANEGGFFREDSNCVDDESGGGFIPDENNNLTDRADDEQSLLSEDSDMDNEDMDWF